MSTIICPKSSRNRNPEVVEVVHGIFWWRYHQVCFYASDRAEPLGEYVLLSASTNAPTPLQSR
jgi:hypothetical protein